MVLCHPIKHGLLKEYLNNLDSCRGRRRLACAKQENGELSLIIVQKFLNIYSDVLLALMPYYKIMVQLFSPSLVHLNPVYYLNGNRSNPWMPDRKRITGIGTAMSGFERVRRNKKTSINAVSSP